MVHNGEFLIDLIALPFHVFDLILGMNWLSKHRAIVDCDKKIVLLKCSNLLEVMSTMQARRFLRKGCEAFLALVRASKRGQVI